MTRRRVLLALVVTVLAVGCAAPWWEKMWLAVAYETQRGGLLVYDRNSGNHLLDEDFEYLKKRLEFLPCSEFVLLDRPCTRCTVRDHDYCNEGEFLLTDETQSIVSVYPVKLKNYVLDTIPDRRSLAESRCLCPTCYPERQ